MNNGQRKFDPIVLREFGIDNDIIDPVDEAEREAKALRQEKDRIRRLLLDRMFDHDKPPAKPRPLFTINDQALATPQNLESIAGQAKQGKSALMSATVASWMRPGEEYLGVKCDHQGNPGALLHFDTEQSPYDHWWICENAMRRAQIQQQPSGLYSAHIMDLPLHDRAPAIRVMMETAMEYHGRVFAVFIDGLADLCRNVNDIDECVALREWAHMLAVEFNTAIFCAIHENEGSDNGKMRGHLGSEIARKAESNLRLQKDGEGIITVWSERSRHLHLTKSDGPRFAWDEETGMHQLAESKAEERKAKNHNSLIETCNDVFADAHAGGLTRTQFMDAIRSLEGLTPGGSRDRFDRIREAGLIKKTKDQKWISNY